MELIRQIKGAEAQGRQVVEQARAEAGRRGVVSMVILPLYLP